MQARRNMENRNQRCGICASQLFWKKISKPLGVAVLALVVLQMWMYFFYLSDADLKEEQRQAALAVSELDEMVLNLYRTISGGAPAPVPAPGGGTEYGSTPMDAHSLMRKIDRTKFYINLLKRNLHRLVLADGIGRADFALESAGARIVSIGETKLLVNPSSNFMQNALNYFGLAHPLIASNNPVNAIRPSMQPGHCFAFSGVGEIVIQLARATTINAVSIDHILPEMSPDGSIRNAPKSFAVYGLRTDAKSTHLGTFVYDISNIYPIQSFVIDKSATEKFQFVRFKFLSNHGHPEHTCVYRVRVHGIVESL